MNGYECQATPVYSVEGKSREALISEYIPKVRLIASMIASKITAPIEFDDLMNAGLVGLLDAIDKFDASRNNKFTTYAEFRIRGAILDSLRSLDLLTRTAREKANNLKKTVQRLQKEYGREPSSEEVAKTMGLDIDSYYLLLDEVKAVTVWSLDATTSDKKGEEGRSLADTLPDNSSVDAFSMLAEHDFRASLKLSVKGLPDRLRHIVLLYYFKELNFKEIGKVLDISESRVCQLHSEAMIRLKARIEKMIGNDL